MRFAEIIGWKSVPNKPSLDLHNVSDFRKCVCSIENVSVFAFLMTCERVVDPTVYDLTMSLL